MTTITINRAVVEQALAALCEETAWFGPTPKGAAAITALRAALAEPVQEQPICDECGRKKADGWALYCVDCVEPVFAPPQRKPLTEEEIDALALDDDGLPNSHLEFARAIERAHGIGGNDE